MPSLFSYRFGTKTPNTSFERDRLRRPLNSNDKARQLGNRYDLSVQRALAEDVIALFPKDGD